MTYSDQLNNKIILDKIPRKIVSLVPSQSELLFDLGLSERICGVTKFCILPKDKVRSKIKIGGTKNLNIELIKSINPDLIIAGKEENDKEQIMQLKRYFPVWVSNVTNFESALDMIREISFITGEEFAGNKIINYIQKQYNKFENNNFKKHKALYFIWRKPYMVAGGDTFIGDMMEKAYFLNEAKQLNRYPAINSDNINDFNPEIILLCDEPYRFGDKHKIEFKKMYPKTQVLLTNGQYFGWYGSRMKYAFKYFKELHKMIKSP